MIAVEVGPLVLEEQIDYARMAIPTRDLQRQAIILPLHIRIHLLLDHQVADDALITDRAGHMQRRITIPSQLVQVDRDVLRHDWHNLQVLGCLLRLLDLHLVEIGRGSLFYLLLLQYLLH